MPNTIRVLYDNLVKTATSFTAGSTASSSTVLANVANDTKTSIWRSGVSGTSTGSTGTASNTISIAFSSPQNLNCIIMPFCNFRNTIRANITVYSTTAYGGTTTSFSAQTIVKGDALGVWNWGNNSLGVNNFSFGTTPYASWYTTTTTVGSMTIQLYDTSPTTASPAFEVGMILAGQYRSPKVNFDTNPEFGFVDTSKQERTDAGNLIVSRGTISKTVSCNFSYIEGSYSDATTTLDKNMLLGIQAMNGIYKPTFFSLFPEDTDPDREQMYQIYGYLKQLNSINQPYNNYYSTSLDIVEV